MEFIKFFKVLKKHKYGLIALPIIAMAITFLIVKRQNSIYFSQSRLSAGLTAGTGSQLAQQLLSGETSELRINQTFSNVTQIMQLKVVFDQVSYQLILHDLTTDKPFRTYSKLFGDLNEDAKKHAIQVYTKMYAQKQSLVLTDPDQKGLNDLIKSMKYDYESLKDKVRVYRVEASDFIDVYYESDDPLLSAFVVNTLCKEFISYYSQLTQQNKVRATDFLHDLMQKKRDSLNAKIDNLKNYKVANKVFNVSDQSKNLSAQVANFENLLQMAEKEVEANTGAINAIDAKFSEQEKQYIEGRLALINQEITATQQQLNVLNEQYIKSNMDPALKAKVDAMKEILAQKINQSTDKYIVNPLHTKESLISQKLKMEMDRELARSSIRSYKNSIGNLTYKLQALAPSEAAIQTYQADIEVLGKEYLELLKRYNESSMQLSTTVPIKVIEHALPGTKLPSKKLMLVMLSGVVSFILYLLILFVLFYLDDSIKEPNDLVNKTDSRVLGALPKIKTSILDVQRLWSIDASNPINTEVKKMIGTVKSDIQAIATPAPSTPVNTEFKKMVRSTRFEINMALMGGRNLVLTSLEEGEGKTLIALSMVSAFQVMNKKVLLIDGNFLNPGITVMTQPKYYIEDYLMGRVSLDQISADGNVNVLGNKGMDVSLFEINNEAVIEQKILELKDVYDIIFIEASALSTLNQSKEWIVVADRVLCVYEANQSISNEMKEQILYLKAMGGKFIGWILNKTTK